MTVEQVAKLARLSVRGVRGVEAGAVPKADTLGRLALVLKVSPSDFYTFR